MGAADIYVEAIKRSDNDLRRAIDGLTVEDLRRQPAGKGSNPIAWLIYHLTRARDNISSSIAGQKSVWDSQGWAAKFGMSDGEPKFTPDNVHTFDPKSLETLTGYFEAVAANSLKIAEGLSEADLKREVPSTMPGRPPQAVTSRLATILNDNIQHVGQVAYLRGLIREQGWY